MIRPITTEKAVRLIELNNTLTFEVDKRDSKDKIKNNIEETFKIKVFSIKSLIRKNRKIIYVKLKPENPAIDVATKLGII